MAPSKMESLPALSRQHLLAEFSGLKQACPRGIFVSLTPGDPTLWSGVVFVRKGPYSPAVLRFQISFPDPYPKAPPLITFSTDMFHPLITPLSTQYSAEVGDSGTVSASDDERLPPGGFSLRHGFPEWFDRNSRNASAAASRRASQVSGLQTPPRRTGGASISATPDSRPSKDGSARTATPSAQGTPGLIRAEKKEKETIATFDVLQYIRSTFDSEIVLDSITLEDSGNPGAWHAWRTHRTQEGKLFDGCPVSAESANSAGGPAPGRPQETAPAVAPAPAAAKAGSAGAAARRPGEWNWEGVWEERVRKGVAKCLSESALFGNAGVPDEVINFIKMDQNEVDTIKDNLSRTLGHAV